MQKETSDQEFIANLIYNDNFGNITENQHLTLLKMFCRDADIVEIRLLKEFYEEILNCEHIEGVTDERRNYFIALYEEGETDESGVKFRILRDQIESGTFDLTSYDDDPF